jgi:hypothetical protein
MKRIRAEGLVALERAAGNGLVDRRFFLSQTALAGASAGAFGWLTSGSAQAEPLSVPVRGGCGAGPIQSTQRTRLWRSVCTDTAP